MNTTCLQSLNNAQSTNPANGNTGTSPCPPQYYTIYPLDSTAFAGDDNCPPYQGPEHEIIRIEESQDESEATLTVDEVPDSIPPPSYDEIFPVVSEGAIER
ncbi:transmembrane protein 174-like [Chiloscyllium punctatum]